MRPTMLFVLFLASCTGDSAALETDTDGVDTDEELPVDLDGDGYASSVDCDDADDAVHPDAVEICNGVDDNCDGVTDEDAVDRVERFVDADGDGFGAAGSGFDSCDADSGVENDEDCNDADPAVHPDAEEVCDPEDVDEDCDGLADDADESAAFVSKHDFYLDGDGDGFGDPGQKILACDLAPGRVLDATDCDDEDAEANPELGCPNAWDGTWDGSLALTVSVPRFGLTTSCTASGQLTLEAGADPELIHKDAAWVCSSGTRTLKVLFDAGFSNLTTMAGTLDAEGLVLPMRIELDDVEGLTASGTSSQVVDGVTVEAEYSLEASRVE